MASPSTVLLVAGVLIASAVGAAAFFLEPGARCQESEIDPEQEAGGSAASVAGKCQRLPFTCPEDPEAVTWAQPSTEETGLLRWEFDMTKRGAEARICIQDRTGTQLIDRTVDLPGRSLTVVETRVPPGSYHVGYLIDDSIVSTHRSVDPTDCPERAYVFMQEVGLGWFGSSSKSSFTADCFDPDEQERDDPTYTLSTQNLAPPDAPLSPTQTVRVALIVTGIAGTIGLAGVTALRLDRFQWVLTGLFTRIRPRQALTHEVRVRIEQAVRADPGIRQDELRIMLGLGHGQSAHHLQILVRHGILEPLMLSGARHFFPAGAHGPEEKKRLALLHHRAARALYEALRSHGESDLTSLAAKCGYSVPYTSRVSARLASAGLVKRRREGQRVLLAHK